MQNHFLYVFSHLYKRVGLSIGRSVGPSVTHKLKSSKSSVLTKTTISTSENTSYAMYRVILKKVSFGIFTIIFVSKDERNFTIESKDKLLSLSKFS